MSVHAPLFLDQKHHTTLKRQVLLATIPGQIKLERELSAREQSVSGSNRLQLLGENLVMTGV